MSTSSTSNESAAERVVSCLSCESHTNVSFGPLGFLSKCADCGKIQHLDDLLEPVQTLSHLFDPVLRFVHIGEQQDEMRISA